MYKISNLIFIKWRAIFGYNKDCNSVFIIVKLMFVKQNNTCILVYVANFFFLIYIIYN